MIKTWYLTIILVFLSCTILCAQVPAWGGGADQNDLSFGFIFSYVQNNYKIVKNPNWRSPYYDKSVNKYITDSLTSIGSPRKPGFALGFITRYSLNDHLEARVTPSLIFADRQLDYTYTNATQNVSKQVQPTLVEFPLSLKLKSDRINNFRAYILGGVKYSETIGKGQSDPSSNPLDKLVKNTGGYGSYEAGLGFDFYFEFFKLSPEIKISNSFGNILVPENQPFSAPISKLSLHTIMFSLYFE